MAGILWSWILGGSCIYGGADQIKNLNVQNSVLAYSQTLSHGDLMHVHCAIIVNLLISSYAGLTQVELCKIKLQNGFIDQENGLSIG